MKIHCISAKALQHGCIDGKIDGFRFQMKVYDTDSKFGIEGGRISKLNVWMEQAHKTDRASTEVISYDRVGIKNRFPKSMRAFCRLCWVTARRSLPRNIGRSWQQKNHSR